MAHSPTSDRAFAEFLLSARTDPAAHVRRLVREGVELFNEFDAFVQTVPKVPEWYRSKLQNLMQFMASEYRIERAFVSLPAGYGTNRSGPLYWRFLHFASILVQHNLTRSIEHGVYAFPTLLSCLDCMLPCDVCKAHFAALRQRDEHNAFTQLLKDASFGYTVNAVFRLHNLVTQNVSLLAGASYRPFMPTDFVDVYGLLPVRLEDKVLNNKYYRGGLVYQSPEHRDLCLLFCAVAGNSSSLLTYMAAFSHLNNYLESSELKTTALTERMYYAIASPDFEVVRDDDDKTLSESDSELVRAAVERLRKRWQTFNEKR